jgi:hypothetical protein
MTEAPVAAASSGSYVARHWRGELSLPKSYWVNGVVIGIACRIVFSGLLTGIAAAAASMPAFALLFAVVVLVNIAIVAWMIVGIWRSAGRYAGPKYWAILARVAVVIGAAGGVIVEIDNVANLADFMSRGG